LISNSHFGKKLFKLSHMSLQYWHVRELEPLKERGLFDTIVGSFRQRLPTLPDKRTGKNTRYGMDDAALSAFSVFFTQTPSFVAYQRMMEGSKGQSNAQSLFGVHQKQARQPHPGPARPSDT